MMSPSCSMLVARPVCCPPGCLEKRLGVLTYPGRFPAKDLELSGYLRPGQDSVRIAVTVRDGMGY